MYRTSDPYATLCTQVRAAEAREDAIAAAMDDTLQNFRSNPMRRMAAYWSMRPIAPLMSDLVAWVNETDGDPDDTLAKALSNPEMWLAPLQEKYALARAEKETKNRDFASEAQDARAWERGGHV
jgi:hypothetical protein